MQLLRQGLLEDLDKDLEKLGRALRWSIFVVPLVKWAWPAVVPFSYGHVLRPRGHIGHWLQAGWPILLWGATIAALVAFTTRNSRRENAEAERFLAVGFFRSLQAGVLEELLFRWLLLFGAIVGVKLSNWLFFGWAGFGVAQWVQLHVLGPVANFTTLGLLKVYLVTPENWAIGAAILGANAFFRDGHKYQGVFGWLNSWFGGMFLFYLMFRFGLPAAIVVHFLYDLGIFAVYYLDRVIERSQARRAEIRSRTNNRGPGSRSGLVSSYLETIPVRDGCNPSLR